MTSVLINRCVTFGIALLTAFFFFFNLSALRARCRVWKASSQRRNGVVCRVRSARNVAYRLYLDTTRGRATAGDGPLRVDATTNWYLVVDRLSCWRAVASSRLQIFIVLLYTLQTTIDNKEMDRPCLC